MSGHKCRARVRYDFMVPVRCLKNGRSKEKLKEFHGGQWLKGRLVEVHGRRYFRSGNFLLNTAHFDRFKFPNGEGPSVAELHDILKSVEIDVHDPYKLLP